MGFVSKKDIIEDVETELGNDILVKLKSEGWKVVSQYSPLAFDKGIDFDSYKLKLGDEILEFEWDNWTEWCIKGTEKAISNISTRFSLKIKKR